MLFRSYINTLATKGFIGFISYYLILMLSWFFIFLKGFYKLKSNHNRYILASFGAGVIVYLTQVLFNFGVVATLFIFYVYMGLTLALVNHKKFQEDD